MVKLGDIFDVGMTHSVEIWHGMGIPRLCLQYDSHSRHRDWELIKGILDLFLGLDLYHKADVNSPSK